MKPVLIVLEQRGESWNRVSWEAMAAGAELARQTGQDLIVAALASSDVATVPDLSDFEVTRIVLVRHELLDRYTAEGYITALAQLIQNVEPGYVLFPHTYQVRDYVPRLAARFGQMLIADVVEFRLDEGRPLWVRQLFQGKLNADYRHSGDGPCFVSIQAGAFRAPDLPSGVANVELFRPVIAASVVSARPEPPFRESAATVDLTAAPVIVSVGRGIKEKDNIPMVEELANALSAELAASRPICDNGWLPMDRQVGSSGQTVSPKLYLAVGISGAIQHLVGMKGSKTIIAINKDENAPIFEVADYGVVGDLFEVVPALTAAVTKTRQPAS